MKALLLISNLVLFFCLNSPLASADHRELESLTADQHLFMHVQERIQTSEIDIAEKPHTSENQKDILIATPLKA